MGGRNKEKESQARERLGGSFREQLRGIDRKGRSTEEGLRERIVTNTLFHGRKPGGKEEGAGS